ncbi:MFS transporter [Advenella mimigardefordensis]|uniref:Transport protein, MFS-type n=1 Tax=Advenella mimigardefordensis (strain DSM 17166 / LMG 22922 / DPN7) TaxID=1247726 RepID=W0PJN5_ADVMD|nr:MFS transporter [Advenella mimigardefordensis]AHG65188.1 transport protein, MFS-type [Advenella mimigardefordensis DPN7]
MTETDKNVTLLRIPGVAALMWVVALGIGSFSILLPLSPDWAIRGGASEAAAGSVTAILMAFTILTQLSVNRALKRFGWGPLLATGLLALGAPALLQATSSALSVILLSSAIRGIGFGILTVSGATAIALLVPAARRGAAVGIYGLAVAGPQLVLVSSAPILEQLMGKLVVTLIATLPVLGLFWTQALGRLLNERSTQQHTSAMHASTHSKSTFAVISPVLLSLVIVTSSGGAILTFASQITADASSATIALLCLTGFATPTRWALGSMSDRYPARYLIFGLALACCLGMAALGASVHTANTSWGLTALYLGSTLLGISYGGMQSATLVCAYQLAGNSRLAQVSVLWNVTFDLGTGVGAMLTGIIAASTGFAAAFAFLSVAAALSAMIILISLRPAKV